MKLRLALALALAAWPAVAQPPNPGISPQPSLPEITTGQQVTIQGSNFQSGVTYLVDLRTGTEPAGQKIQLPATAAADQKSLTFRLDPKLVTVGRYTVTVEAG